MKQIAYFSMEVGIRADMPTYSGGLGVLAGDTLKSAADLGLPVIGMTLLHRKGYFTQSIVNGRQQSAEVSWEPSKFMKRLNVSVTVEVESKPVKIGAWVYDIVGHSGHIVPVVMLDTSDSTNDSYHQSLSGSLYGGDDRYRICQEIILGIGGVRILDELGRMRVLPQLKTAVTTYHMNEGHASFLTLELLRRAGGDTPRRADLDLVKKQCVFTTHTPVAAGHDRFGSAMATQALGSKTMSLLGELEVLEKDGSLNMTHLALKLSRYVNGVAKRHGEVSRAMFPGHEITAITNGVHSGTWINPAMGVLYDQYMPGWRQDQNFLRYACEIPLDALKQARKLAKKSLVERVQSQFGVEWTTERFTIGFARRAATYKRADLLFWDCDRLVKMAERFGGLQICFSGKAHPKDEGGQALIAKVVAAAERLKSSPVSVVFMPNYDMDLGLLITSGVDVWLNNPVKPMEASGTSGMKSALNAIPNLSTLDGWWVEGCFEGVTGWEIEDAEDAMKLKSESGVMSAQAAEALYTKLETVVLPMYSERPDDYLKVMRQSVAVNGPFFSTQRMVEQYARLAW